jgi:hypothetical protein
MPGMRSRLRSPAEPAAPAGEAIPLSVLFEDDELIIRRTLGGSDELLACTGKSGSFPVI